MKKSVFFFLFMLLSRHLSAQIALAPKLLSNFEPSATQGGAPLLNGSTPLPGGGAAGSGRLGTSYLWPELPCTAQGNTGVPYITPDNSSGGGFEGYQLARAPSDNNWAVVRYCGVNGGNPTNPWVWGYDFGGAAMNNNFFMGAVQLPWMAASHSDGSTTNMQSGASNGTTPVVVWEQVQTTYAYAFYPAGTRFRVSANVLALASSSLYALTHDRLINPNRCVFSCEVRVTDASSGALIASSNPITQGTATSTVQTVQTSEFTMPTANTKVSIILRPVADASIFVPSGPNSPVPAARVQNMAYFGLDDVTLTTEQPCLLPTPIVADVIACDYAPITLQASYSGGALPGGITYQWYRVNNSVSTAIAGATNSTYSPNTPSTTTPLPYSERYEVALVKGSDVMSARAQVLATWTTQPNPNPSGAWLPATPVKGITVTTATPFVATPNYSYSWDWGDGQKTTAPPHIYQQGGNYNVQVTVTRITAPYCQTITTFPISVSSILCETLLPLQGGAMTQDRVSGVFMLSTAQCNQGAVAFDCLSGQPNESRDPRQVVSATAAPLAPAQVVTGIGSGYGVTDQDVITNPFLTGSAYLQPETSHSYRDVTSIGKNKEAGRFHPRPFGWGLSLLNRPRAWVPAGQVTRFSPQGEGVEERDALGVPSTVRFGYLGKAVPYLTGKNASYNSVCFESFENVGLNDQGVSINTPLFEDGSSISTSQGAITQVFAHSGLQSIQLTSSAGPYQFTLPALPGLPNDWLRSGGVKVMVWVRVADASTTTKPKSWQQWAPVGGTSPLYAEIVSNLSGGQTSVSAQSYAMKIVGQSGEWSLCQALIPASSFSTTIPVSTSIRLGFTAPSSGGMPQVWLDDARIQPIQAQVSTYVYDRLTLKLLASFDDQHFGLFYQYDSEGRLVRKLIETERGRKTVQETQYNVPKVARTP